MNDAEKSIAFWRRHRLRSHPDGALAGALGPEGRTSVTLRTNESIAAKASFFEDLKREARRHGEETLRDGLDLCPEPFRTAPFAFELEDDLQFNAGAWMEDGTHKVGLPIGAVLAIEDLCLTLCCSPNFLMAADLIFSGDDDSDLPYSIPMVGSRLKLRNRYDDYSQMEDEDFLNRARLSYNLPTAPWRLEHYRLIRDIALDWIMFHEVGHHLQGHVAFAGEGDHQMLREDARIRTVRRATTAEDGFSAEDTAPISHCLELQADALALTLLRRLWIDSDKREARFSNAGRAIAEYLAEIGEGGALNTDDIRERQRLVFVGAGIALLALDTLSDGAEASDTHPRVQTRLLNFVNQLLIEAPFFESAGGGAYVSLDDGEDNRADGSDIYTEYLDRIMGPAALDLNFVAEELGLPPFATDLKHLDEIYAALKHEGVLDGGLEPLIAHKSALSRLYVHWYFDLMLMMNGADETQLISDAGRAFASLVSIQMRLAPVLRRQMVERFGDAYLVL